MTDDATSTRSGGPTESDLHYVTAAADLDDGDRAIVDVEGREIAVFRIGDEFFALLNYCVHQGGPGCEGRIAGTLTESEDGRLGYDRWGEIVSCPWHGWEFDIRTGEHMARSDYRIPAYDVVEQDGDLYVAL